MLAHDNSIYTVTFLDDLGNKVTYDCTTPSNCFEAFLEEFLKAKKAGKLKNEPNQDKIKEITGLLDYDAYKAGKLAFLYMRDNETFSFRFSNKKKIRVAVSLVNFVAL